MTTTHTYTAKTDIDGDASPFTGLKVELVTRFGMSPAGFDCLIRLDCTPEELAARYTRALSRRHLAAEMVDFHGAESFDLDLPAGLYAECCEADDLTELRR